MTKGRVKLAAVLAAALALAALAGAANAFNRKAEPMDGMSNGAPYALTADCVLSRYNMCSCWTWVLSDGPNSEWGSVFNPNDCPGGCASGGSLTDIWFFSKCVTPPPRPRTIGGVKVHAVDAVACRTALLWNSGPLTITHCTSTDGWTHIIVPDGATSFGGNPFAVSIKWGSTTYGIPPDTDFRLVSDNGIANLFCSQGTIGFPGCETTSCSCPGWAGLIPPENSYIYVTDYNGDGVVDDICAIRGAPYSLAFPLVQPYGYLPNNLLIQVGLKCSLPTSVPGSPDTQGDSWGRVKTLFH